MEFESAMLGASLDRLWVTMIRSSPILIKDWLTCFNDDAEVAKHEIQSTLETRDAWENQRRNFLLRLISDDEKGYLDASGRYKPRVPLAMAFVQRMTENPQFRDFILTTVNVSREQDAAESPTGSDTYLRMARAMDQCGTEISMKELNKRTRRRGNGLLHEAARFGRCNDLRKFLPQRNVDEGRFDGEPSVKVGTRNNVGETALHLAAEYENADDVELLLEYGAGFEVERHGCTPLHSAAMAINPSPRVAKLLIDAVKEQEAKEKQESIPVPSAPMAANRSPKVAEVSANDIKEKNQEETETTDEVLANANNNNAEGKHT